MFRFSTYVTCSKEIFYHEMKIQRYNLAHLNLFRSILASNTVIYTTQVPPSSS